MSAHNMASMLLGERLQGGLPISRGEINMGLLLYLHLFCGEA